MKASCLRSPLLMACLLLSLAGQGVCEERRVLRFGFIDSDTNFPEFAIVKLAAKKLNWKVGIWECPSWKRCLLMIESGDLDMIGWLFKTPEREFFMYYIEPSYFTERMVLYFLKGKGSDVREYKDLTGLTIGVMIGAKYFEPFDSDATLDKFETPGVADQDLKMLKAGRIDALIAEEGAWDQYIKDSEFNGKFEKAPYSVDAGNDYFVISKKSPYAKDRFKFGEVLKQLIDSGKVKEIFNKYGLEWIPPTQQAPK